jgi:hypothetical protein
VRGQLKSELETGTGRAPKEIPPKTGIRQQATERAFHISLTHAFPSRKDCTKRVSAFEGRFGAASHVNV